MIQEIIIKYSIFCALIAGVSIVGIIIGGFIIWYKGWIWRKQQILKSEFVKTKLYEIQMRFAPLKEDVEKYKQSAADLQKKLESAINNKLDKIESSFNKCVDGIKKAMDNSKLPNKEVDKNINELEKMLYDLRKDVNTWMSSAKSKTNDEYEGIKTKIDILSDQLQKIYNSALDELMQPKHKMHAYLYVSLSIMFLCMKIEVIVALLLSIILFCCRFCCSVACNILSLNVEQVSQILNIDKSIISYVNTINLSVIGIFIFFILAFIALLVICKGVYESIRLIIFHNKIFFDGWGIVSRIILSDKVDETDLIKQIDNIVQNNIFFKRSSTILNILFGRTEE